MKFGVVRFPGSCDEVDAQLACELVGDAELLWHADRDLRGVDAVVVPGGFSYGDYLRVGAIARFAPVMESVIEFAGEADLERAREIADKLLANPVIEDFTVRLDAAAAEVA